MGLGALEGMNVPKTHIEMYYELLSLIFTFKPSDSTATRGQRMTQQDKQKLKDMFYENPFDGKYISTCTYYVIQLAFIECVCFSMNSWRHKQVFRVTAPRYFVRNERNSNIEKYQ